MIQGFPIERSEKRKVLLGAVESVREVLAACADEAETFRTLPTATVEALKTSGLLALKLPTVLGGAEADPVTQIEIIEAVTRIDTSAGWCTMTGATSIGLPGAFLADEAIAQIFIDGSLPTAAGTPRPVGIAVPTDGGYRVSGRWGFASGIRHAQWTIGGTRVIRDDGSPPELRMVVFPTTEAYIHDNWQVGGLQGTGSCDFSVADLFVPDAFTWDLIRAQPQRGGPLYHLRRPGFVTNEHAAFALGVGRHALDAIIDQAQSKERGLQELSLIAARPVFQRAVGECDLRLRAARALVIEIYEEAWAAVCANHTLPARLQAEMRSVATFATEVAVDVVTCAFRYGGGTALYQANILQRCLRDVNAAAQHVMVSDTAYENHGQFALGLPGAKPYGVMLARIAYGKRWCTPRARLRCAYRYHRRENLDPIFAVA
jgi:alkylation response protein AidB-like acyl-CoA dehydrogenase